jgi:hypothetical protein
LFSLAQTDGWKERVDSVESALLKAAMALSEAKIGDNQ